MTDSQFMGMLITAIATLLGITSVMVVIIIKPIINLNKTITKLDTTIVNMQSEHDNLKSRVDKHGGEIDEVKLTVLKHEEELKHHSTEIAGLQMKKR